MTGWLSYLDCDFPRLSGTLKACYDIVVLHLIASALRGNEVTVYTETNHKFSRNLKLMKLLENKKETTVTAEERINTYESSCELQWWTKPKCPVPATVKTCDLSPYKLVTSSPAEGKWLGVRPLYHNKAIFLLMPLFTWFSRKNLNPCVTLCYEWPCSQGQGHVTQSCLYRSPFSCLSMTSDIGNPKRLITNTRKSC